MAPLPPSSTKRYFLDYTVGTVQHTVMVRVANNITDAEVIEDLDDFLNAVVSFLYEIVIVGLRVALDGSNVTNPVTWTGDATYGNGEADAAGPLRFFSFHGRSDDGRRTNLTMFGSKIADDTNFRITPAESETVGTVVALLNGAGNNWITISDAPPVWKSYMNVGYNAYWQRHIRVG